jgi:hypothetical protein
MTKEEVKQLLPILVAFAEGKAIECRTKPDRLKGVVDIPNKWTETNEIWCVNSLEYRIKPEQEPKYRPFMDAEECWTEMLKHQPFGWIKCKGGCFNIVYVNDFYAGLGDKDGSAILLASKNSYQDNTFADGTPFGVKEET